MAVVALTMEASLDEEAAGAGAAGVGAGASVVAAAAVASTPVKLSTEAVRDEPALARAEFRAVWKVAAKPAPLMVEVAVAASDALVKPSV